jgi:hypothetical protein
MAEEEKRLLGFLCLGFFCVWLPSLEENCPLGNLFSSCMWLNVDLYRKSLHVLFKEILQ